MSSLTNVMLTEDEFRAVQALIYRHAGISLGDSKQVMVQTRLNKRIRKLRVNGVSEYLSYLSQPGNEHETIAFINALTTNKTEFFREAHHFDFLSAEALPEVFARQDKGERKLRIWCSAASTGEEPYTIAMAVREFFGSTTGWDIRILASDIDTDVLATAERGVYSEERLECLPNRLLGKYFDRESRNNKTYRVKSSLRNLITFRRLNLNSENWPISTIFDMIFCRNALIYFDKPGQREIIQNFGRHLAVDGYLFLGHSESICGLSDLFEPLGNTVFRRLYCDVAQKVSARKEGNFEPSDGCQIIEKKDNGKSDVVHPIIIGEVFVSKEPIWISTSLGSCVSVCLYDEANKVGGMNHFMLPIPSDDSAERNRYGIHAMELLINSMMNRGANRHHLKAKIFGGNNVGDNGFANIGAKNLQFAKRFLETEGIPIVACFTDQRVGMHLKFHTHSNKAVVRLLDHKTTRAIERQDESQSALILENLSRHNDATLFN